MSSCAVASPPCRNAGPTSTELQEAMHKNKLLSYSNTLPAIFSGADLSEKQAPGARGADLGLGLHSFQLILCQANVIGLVLCSWSDYFSIEKGPIAVMSMSPTQRCRAKLRIDEGFRIL